MSLSAASSSFSATGVEQSSIVSYFDVEVSSSESEASTSFASSQYGTYTLAQSFDQDVMGDIRSGFTNFVETGQVWALLIGLVLGYVIRGLTR